MRAPWLFISPAKLGSSTSGAKLCSPGVVAYSTDGGSNWREATGLPYDQSVEALAGQPTSTTLFAYCYGGDSYTSADGGGIWTLLTRALRSSAE